jgi:hypothetical protein
MGIVYRKQANAYFTAQIAVSRQLFKNNTRKELGKLKNLP